MYCITQDIENSYKSLSDEIKKELVNTFKGKGINVAMVEIAHNTGKLNIEVCIKVQEDDIKCVYRNVK